MSTGWTAEVRLSAQTLPSPWQSKDIGNPSAAGSAAHSSGTYTVKGAGADIWGSRDQFHFVYQPAVGDVDIRVRVASIQNVDSWSKAGVMIRATLAADSRHAMALTSVGRGYAFQRRIKNGGTTDNTSGGSGSAPGWVRLVRSGLLVHAFRSADGQNWTSISSDVMALPDTFYVGLAVTSHQTGTLAQAVFDNVQVTKLDAEPNKAPSISLTGPAGGAAFTAPANIAMTAGASDTDGQVARVEFFAGNFLVGTDTSAPYSVTWGSVAAGSYALSAIAYDDEGASTRSANVNVTVKSGTDQLPAVLLTSPSNGATFAAPATLTLTAGASDSASKFARVDFFANGTRVASDTSSPYSFTWTDVPAGTYVITALAYDGSTGAGSASTASTVTVSGGGAGTPAPKLVVFEASADHGDVKRYVLEIFAAGADPSKAKALATSDLGKPAANVAGEISVDRSAVFSALAAGNYLATVRAENSSGFNRSMAVPFTR